jgi:O-antigen/teichoic acid export membrane protein
VTASPPAETPKNKSVFKPVLLLMSGRVTAFVATFFIPVILARIFDPVTFGTYKQLFLIQSTIYFMIQLGMATSLYYFLPLDAEEAGKYVANSIVFLGAAGLAGAGALVAASPMIARSMSNPALGPYLPWTAFYLFLMMLSAGFEIVLISRGKYLWASAAYGLTDLSRAAAFIIPVVLFHKLDWLLRGGVILAGLKAVLAILYFRSAFGATFKMDKVLMRKQLAYALPLGMAVLVEITQQNLPPYFVSWLSDPATFAVFAVGCLQIPLVEFATSPTSDVMMVRMQESLAAGNLPGVLDIWHDTTWKLALMFFPLTALVIASGREIITLLFTHKYDAAVPLFMVWSSIIAIQILQVDGVLRVFAQTRLILILNLMRLVIVGGLIAVAIRQFHLMGAVVVMLLAQFLFKIAALSRMGRLLDVSAARLLPWRRLSALAGASVAAALAAMLVRTRLHSPLFGILVVMGIVHVIVFGLIVWFFNLLHEDERLAISSWIQKKTGRFSAVSVRS